ncbi:MAG: phosphodiesterase [Candidatus Aquicultorales bacterium]
MKIGAISDTHGDTLAWERALVLFTGCDLIVHCGDILYHGPFNPILGTYAPRQLADAMNESPLPIVFAKGNCDSEVDQLALGYPIQQPMAHIKLHEVSLLVLHGDKYDEKGLEKLGRSYGVDIIVRGHTHERTVKDIGGLTVMNPGSASLPKDGPPSAAIVNTDERKIRIFGLEKRDVLVEEGF